MNVFKVMIMTYLKIPFVIQNHYSLLKVRHYILQNNIQENPIYYSLDFDVFFYISRIFLFYFFILQTTDHIIYIQQFVKS